MREEGETGKRPKNEDLERGMEGSAERGGGEKGAEY
jgi:hypothetical protein